jgi:ABC-type sugar transport system ATPase subunit
MDASDTAGLPAGSSDKIETVESTERPPVVEFKNVSKVFATGHTAIKNVNFRVEDRPGHGEFIAILGPSGCGKSTILRQIAGLSPHHPPTTGTVHVFGKPVVKPGADRGMVFQDYTSFDHRTVQDNVAFGLECQGVPIYCSYRNFIRKVVKNQTSFAKLDGLLSLLLQQQTDQGMEDAFELTFAVGIGKNQAAHGIAVKRAFGGDHGFAKLSE